MIRSSKIYNYSVPDEEQLARGIFSPSMLSEGKINHEAFDLCDLEYVDKTGAKKIKEENDISLIRLINLATSDELEEKLRKLNPRTPGDTVSGYAILTAGDCRKCTLIISEGEELKVDVHSKNESHVHASLYYFHGGVVLQGDQARKGEIPDQIWEAIRTQLAEISVYHPLNISYKGQVTSDK